MRAFTRGVRSKKHITNDQEKTGLSFAYCSLCLVSLVSFYERLIVDRDEVFDAVVRCADFTATSTKLLNGVLGCNRVVW